jgi:hypothetical protein
MQGPVTLALLFGGCHFAPSVFVMLRRERYVSLKLAAAPTLANPDKKGVSAMLQMGAGVRRNFSVFKNCSWPMGRS